MANLQKFRRTVSTTEDLDKVQDAIRDCVDPLVQIITGLGGLNPSLAVGSIPIAFLAMFVGMEASFSAITAPKLWLEKKGQLISRVTYPELTAFALASGNISATDGAWTKGQFSPGDGTTTIRLPDQRGYFDRAWDDSAGVDGGRTIGSIQAQGTKLPTTPFTPTVTDPGHDHTPSNGDKFRTNPPGGGGGFLTLTAGGTDSNVVDKTNKVSTGITVALTTGGDAETRPISIATLRCIFALH